jgi:rhamnosyltransferase
MNDILRENPLVSIIIRTKNEEKWITLCLDALNKQSYKNFEIIIVDNYSNDKTIQKIKKYNVKKVFIKNFLPGKAINQGIKQSKGKIIVCLSAHCIPVSNSWLKNLIKNLSDNKVAGVYGRQEPLSYSSDFDKRDLITIFGLDKKVQIKDPFFHNANSAFLRSTWKKFPFDEKVTNIEDRVWGHQVIKKKLQIIYEPEASVYHYHGIHHSLDKNRAKNVVKILEEFTKKIKNKKSLINSKRLKVAVIIPSIGSRKFKNKSLLDFTIKSAKESKLVSEIFIAVDNTKNKNKYKRDKKISIIQRPKSLSKDYISVVDVLKFSVDYLEKKDKYFDCIVCLLENYPYRPKGLIDKMIHSLIKNGFETIIAGKPEKRTVWLKEKSNKMNLLFNGFVPSNLKENYLIMSLFGLCSVTYAKNIREQDLFSEKLGIYEIKDPINSIEYKQNILK